MLSNTIETQLSDRTARGVDRFLSSFARVAAGDGVIICFTRPCLSAAALMIAGLQTRGIPFRAHAYAHKDAERFERELEGYVASLRAEPRIRRVVIISCELDTLSFSKVLRRRARDSSAEISVVRVTNCVPELFELAFQLTPEVQRQINAGALHALMDAKRIRVTADNGTDLTIELDPSRFSWISSTGRVGPMEILNLPAGEISTYPASVNGIFVADGGLNSNLELPFDVRLAGRPMTFVIEDGEVAKFHCPDPELMKFLSWNFEKPFARRVGELGIGTNVGIDRFIPLSSHINERHPGMHLGFGEHNQPGRVDYKAEVHLDAIIAGAIITTNTGKVLDTHRMEPSLIAHPEGLRSEDAEALAALGIAGPSCTCFQF